MRLLKQFDPDLGLTTGQIAIGEYGSKQLPTEILRASKRHVRLKVAKFPVDFAFVVGRGWAPGNNNASP